MAAEILDEYTLSSIEAVYVNPGKKLPMRLMALDGEIQVSEKTSP